MKAVVQNKYGSPDSVLHLRDIPIPSIGPNDVLVRVRAASVHPDVWHVVTGVPYVLRLMGSGLSRPRQRVPGTDLSGIVESIGSGVTAFRPGDAVFGESHTGFQWVNGGAFAEFAAVPAGNVVLKPANVSFEQAAAVPSSGFIALANLRQAAPLQRGQRVLINGAGGGVGSIAIQVAKAAGAHVTAVDREAKFPTMRALGADALIDCTRDTLTKTGERFDVVLDVASNLSAAETKLLLAPGGTYVFIGHDHYGAAAGRVLGSLPRAVAQLARVAFTRNSRASLPMPEKQEVMSALAGLMQSGQLTPVIDRVFTLDQVREAMAYLQTGRACGKIVLTA